MASAKEIRFGSFRFEKAEQSLWENDRRVRLGPRALAILRVLLEEPGRLVSRRELLERVWPGVNVDEANLRVQIGSLRKALGDYGSLVRAEAGLGYRFMGASPQGGEATPPSRSRNPKMTFVPIGRDAAEDAIIDLVQRSRLVTILGPGGIGKTTVALMVVERIGDTFSDGARFIDLAQATSAEQAYTAVSRALGIDAHPSTVPEDIAAALEDRHVLLVLDCCEPLIESISALIRQLLAKTDRVCVLTTSRELLRVSGEVVYRLEPLDTPPSEAPALLDKVQDYAAVQLFLRVADQVAVPITLDDANARHIAEICRRLDGIPLAIELAASMAPFIGLDQIRRGLDERFSLLVLGPRSAVPRHKTLEATYDWSYKLLTENEQAALRRLAAFDGPFCLDAAGAVVADEQIPAMPAREAVVGLIQKSLLSLAPGTVLPCYRLLDCTHAYALRTPAPKGERDAAAERHARYFLTVLENRDWETFDLVAQRPRLNSELEECRVALDWAFQAHPLLGIQLTIAAERLWTEATSIAQGLPYLLRARQHLEAPGSDPLLKAKVLGAIAAVHAEAEVPGEDPQAAHEQAWAAAKAAQDPFLELRALFQLSTRVSPSYVEEFNTVAEQIGDGAAKTFARSLRAYGYFSLSDLAAATRAFDESVANYPKISREYEAYFRTKTWTLVGSGVASYQMGHFSKGRHELSIAIEEAELSGHPMSILFAYSYGGIWCEIVSGNLDLAAQRLERLDEVTRPYKPWQAMALAYRGMLIKRQGGDLQLAEELLSEGLERGFSLLIAPLLPPMLAELAEARFFKHDLDGAAAVIDRLQGLALVDRDAFVDTQSLRLKAMMARARYAPGHLDEAKGLFLRSMEIARFRSHIHGEIEAALAFMDLLLAEGRKGEVSTLALDLLSRLPEGHEPDELHTRALRARMT